MRIISGTYKGKRLVAPKNLPVRPTTDFAKEALFNILNNWYSFSSISLLDLFAGTGNISYEFASRGASNITCVDANQECINFINKTAETLGFPIETSKSDVFSFLEKTKKSATIVFADPPYDMPIESLEQIVSLIFENDILEKNGILILEHAKHTDLSTLPNFSESRRYGGCVFSFFEWPEAN